MNAGYAIWRELAAEIIAESIDFRPDYSLSDIKGDIEEDMQNLYAGNPAAKAAMVNLLTEVLFATELDTEEWSKAESALRKIGLPFYRIIEEIFEQLRREPFYFICYSGLEYVQTNILS